jgi:hypothetical protein
MVVSLSRLALVSKKFGPRKPSYVSLPSAPDPKAGEDTVTELVEVLVLFGPVITPFNQSFLLCGML